MTDSRSTDPMVQPQQVNECLATGSRIVEVCVPVSVIPSATCGTPMVTCCGPARASGQPCEGVPGQTCTFFITQQLCVEVPVTFTAQAVCDVPFVGCGPVGPCDCPPPG